MTPSETFENFDLHTLIEDRQIAKQPLNNDEKHKIYSIGRGLRVHPVWPNKVPMLKGYQKKASNSHDVIAEWLREFPNCNWGVVLDADTFVIDCDSNEALAALYNLGEPHGGIPFTLTTITARGVHLWFRTRVMLRNRLSLMSGLDIKTNGGHIVVPPSVHLDGSVYRFADDEAPIAEAPEWILQLLTCGKNVNADAQSVKATTVTSEFLEESTPFQKDIETRRWEIRIARGKVPDGRSPRSLRILLEPHRITEGTRNTAMFAYLCRLKRGGEPEAYIGSEAGRVNAKIPRPMDKSEVFGIISNAMKYAVGSSTLVEAWLEVEEIEAGFGTDNWYRFLLLVEQLEKLRPNTRSTILLPLEVIGVLLDVHFTQVAAWRRRAIEMGILTEVSAYVRRVLATEFSVRLGFSPLADGPDLYKIKRGRKPRSPVKLDEAA